MAWTAGALGQRASAWGFDNRYSNFTFDVEDGELTQLVEQTKAKQFSSGEDEVTFHVAHRLRFVLLLVSITVSASVIPGPSTQFVKLTFFAAGHGGGDCQVTPSSDACRKASSDAAVYHGVAGALSHSIAWLFALMLGSFSDAHGRRPLLLASAFLALLSRLFLGMHLMGHTSLWVFLVVEPMLTIINVDGVFLAVMNDVIKERKQRIVANSVTMGVMLGSGGLAGIIGGSLPARMAVIISIILGMLQIAYLILSFPETVPVRLRGGIETITNSDLNPRDLIRDSAQVLQKSPFTYRMTLVLVFYGLSATGFHNTFVPYLAAYLGFDQHRNGQLMLAGAVSIIAAFIFLMRPLISTCGEIGAVRYLLALKVVFYMLLCCAWTVPQVFLVYFALLGPVVLLIPIIAGITSNLVDDEEQGRMQGILTAVKVLATAVGEIFFTWFYKYSTHGGANPHRVSALPPLLTSVALGVVAFMLASSLDPQEIGKNRESGYQRSMSSM